MIIIKNKPERERTERWDEGLPSPADDELPLPAMVERNGGDGERPVVVVLPVALRKT